MDKTKVKKTIKKVEEKVKTVVPKVEKNNADMEKTTKKMRKTIIGTVVSTKMEKTVVVSYTRKVAHKKYGKLIKVTKKIKADTNGMEIGLGDTVKIEQTRPISKDKYFKVIATPTAKALGVKKEESGK